MIFYSNFLSYIKISCISDATVKYVKKKKKLDSVFPIYWPFFYFMALNITVLLKSFFASFLWQNQKKTSRFFDWFGFLSDKQENEEDGSITFGLANLFRCMCCTYPKPDSSKIHLLKIGEQLENLNVKITNLQRQIDSSISRPSGFRRR